MSTATVSLQVQHSQVEVELVTILPRYFSDLCICCVCLCVCRCEGRGICSFMTTDPAIRSLQLLILSRVSGCGQW